MITLEAFGFAKKNLRERRVLYFVTKSSGQHPRAFFHLYLKWFCFVQTHFHFHLSFIVLSDPTVGARPKKSCDEVERRIGPPSFVHRYLRPPRALWAPDIGPEVYDPSLAAKELPDPIRLFLGLPFFYFIFSCPEPFSIGFARASLDSEK